MGRPPHIHFDGAVYHVTSRGVRRISVFADEIDKQTFTQLLLKARARYGFKILALCIMSNHFHLLIQVGRVTLSKIMQVVLRAYSRYYNRKNGTTGHVFEERFFRGLVRAETYLGVVIGYIHANPVKAGIVASSVDWSWSTARQFLDRSSGIADLQAVRDLFGGELPEGLHESLLDLPAEAYAERKMALIYDEEPSAGPDLERLASEFVKGSRLSVGDLRGGARRRDVARMRKEFIWLAAERGAYNSVIARFLNRAPSYITQALAETEIT